MFTKKYIKADSDKHFEDFISSDFSKKSFNDYIDSDIANKLKKTSSQNFWNDNDDNDSSSSIQLGTGNKFLKSSKTFQAPKTTEQSDMNIPKIDVRENGKDNSEMSDLRLNLNESTDKSLDKSSNIINDDQIKTGLYAHPMTFEGITDTMFDRSYSPTLEGDSNFKINKPNIGSETIKSNILTIPIDRSHDNFQQSLDRTDKEHLLSKVSLLDSYDGHKLSKPDDLDSSGLFENVNQKPDDSDEYMYKNSFNPASGDNFNNTQAITNVTDTVIGDTTAADFAALHRQFEKYNNKESFDFNPETNVPLSETIKDLYEEKSAHYDDFSKLNLESTINSKSFGLKVIHPDHGESKSSPIPTPRPRTKNKVSKSDNTEMEIMKDDSVISNSDRNSETNDKPQYKRYSHVKSSGYGNKSVTPNKTSLQNSTKSQPVSIRKKVSQHHSNASNKPTSRSSSKSERNLKSRDHNRSKSVPRNDDRIEQNYPSHIKNQTYFIPTNHIDEKSEYNAVSHFASHADPSNREWQEKWLEERKIVKKLQADSTIQERDVRRQIESITQKYEEQISNLQSQVNRAKQQLQMKPDFVDKLLGPNVTKDDINRIEREMKEQNAILAAYEKDNERLCQEIKILKQQKKGEDFIDTMENERLISQIVSLKADLDSKEIELRNLKQFAKENKLLNATAYMGNKDFHFEQIIELKNELQSLNQKYLHSESERQKAEKKLDIISMEAEKRLSQCKHELEIEHTEREKLKESHKMEVDDLKRKIKWYLENQSILDQNEKKNKIKDNEIAELKHLLETSNSIKISSNIRAKEKLVETEKVKRLENEIMSLKTDLYSLVKGKNIGNVAEKRTVQFLEEKIKSLEADCDMASKKENNAFRSLQQQFEAMKFQYEEKIRDLELDLTRKIDSKSQPEKQTRIADLRANVDELNKELEKKSTTINKLKLEIKKLNKNYTDNQLQGENKLKNIRKIEMNNRTEMLQHALKEKENEVHQLAMQNSLLKDHEQRYNETKLSPNLLELQAENANCKSQIIHLTREISNYRQKLEDIKMSALKNEELIREECRNEIRKCEEFHKENMHNVKMDYANRHSYSEIANLQSQLEVQKSYITHLQGQITEYNMKLANIDTKSDELTEANKQIQNLKTELSDLRLIWSKKPGLEMIDRLRTKIIQLEEKENFRGKQLDEYVDKVVKNNSKQYQDEVERWRTIVAKKNQNLIHVQRELDHLLEALEELRRQGIVIPKLSLRSNSLSNQKFI